MANQEFNIRLEGGGPWGFRLTGGKDFCSPLNVSKITPGGKASYNGLREGDTIVSINYEETRNMAHMDAQDAIKNTGNTLDLSVRRGDSPSLGRAPLTKTDVVHSAKVDHKYNAIPKPFGAPAYQPARQSPVGVQSAPSVRTGPPPTAPKPSSPMAPAYSHYTGGPPRSHPSQDQTDYNSDAALRAKKKEIEEEMLAQRFKLAISDDGEVNYDEESQVPNWGHPPDPNVQSKSFKMLQRHLQKHEEDDDLPPPPPEAYEPEEDHSNVQSKSFQMLKTAVDSGDTPPSVFNRDRGNRSKPSTTPMPTRPVMPIQKSQPEYSAPPPASRPGQAPPVALPGMAIKEPASGPSSGPNFRTQRPHAPSYQHQVPAAPHPPRGPPAPGPQAHQEIKRQPIKPPQPSDGSRTPYCDACGEEIFGPFVSAIGRSWHPDHFTCAGCGESLQNQGFIEEGGKLYCEKDYNKHFAPQCHSCKQPIVGPKSLHACVPPKSPKPSVPPPSPDMLKAIRGGQPTAKISKQVKVNPSLSVKKKSQSEHDFGKVHYPVHGIDYMTRKEMTSHSRSSSVSSDSTGGVVRNGSRSESFTDHEPLVSPQAIQQFERLHHEMTYVEPGSGSMRDKVIELKQELRKVEEQERVARETRILANQRYKKSKMHSNELKMRIQDGEERLQRLEIKVQETRGRLYERQRLMEESLGNKRRAENVTKQTIREKEIFEYEITEANAARDSALTRLREIFRRLTIKKAAIQNAQDHAHAMNARAKMLTDMKEMYRLRITNIHSKSTSLSMKNEKYAQRIRTLQDSITSYTERFKRAEKMLLPLKMYSNQLEDAIGKERSNTMHLSYELANYQQRLRGAQMYSDL